MAIINRSGSIATGGAAQELMAASMVRHGFMVQNVSIGDLWINDLGGTASAAQPSIKIQSGQLYESPDGVDCPYAISIFGATTGQAFTAREW